MTSKTITDYLGQQGLCKRTYPEVCKTIKARGKPEIIKATSNGYQGSTAEIEFFSTLSQTVGDLPAYDLFKSRHRKTLEWVYKRISQGITTKETALDVGCATGLELCFLGQLTKGEVVGIDTCPAMIDQANKRAARLGLENVKAHLGDRDRMNYENEFDRIICCNSIVSDNEFRGPDSDIIFTFTMRDRVSSLKKALKPNGRLIITQGVFEHAGEYELDRLKYFIESGGFFVYNKEIFKENSPLVEIGVSAKASS